MPIAGFLAKSRIEGQKNRAGLEKFMYNFVGICVFGENIVE